VRTFEKTWLTAVFLAVLSALPPLAGAVTIHVPAGGDLQAAIDKAAPGDTITLQPGATYRGLFTLRKKTGNQYITIRIADETLLPPDGVRITPTAAAFLPKLISIDNRPPLKTEPGAHHYRLVGIEILPPQGVYASELILLGTPGATSVSEQPFNIILDRLYIHGDPRVGTKRGITLNSGYTVIKNCYISDIKSTYQDSQAIGGWNGPGPYEIINNYLEASGENVMFGGAPPSIQGIIPSDIVFRRNYCFKPTSWREGSPDFAGTTWIVKNLFELKNARRVLIEHNVFENNWQQAQAGYGIVFTVRAEDGAAPWAVVEDIVFSQNVVKSCGGGVNVLGRDYRSDFKGITRRLLIKDNLFIDIDYIKWGGAGRLFQLLHGPEDVTIDHNTIVTSNLRHLMIFDGENFPAIRLRVTNNISPHGQYGVYGNGVGTGTIALETYARGYVFLKNVLAGGSASKYPADNFFPPDLLSVGFVDYAAGDYRLSGASAYRLAGTDGLDLGADFSTIVAGTSGVLQGTSAPNQPPLAGTVTPSSGQGAIQAFTFAVSDGNGVADLRSALILFNSTLSAAGGCFVRYLRGGNSLSLRDDTGRIWLGPAALGAGGILANSQCEVDVGASSVSAIGNTLNVTVALRFLPSFRGLKVIYLAGEDLALAVSGWQRKGTWTPAPNDPPVAVSVTPASGKGLQQVFQFVVSDPNGAADLRSARLLLNKNLSGTRGCYVMYRLTSKDFWLRDDYGMDWLGPARAGSSGTLANSQCVLDVSISGATSSGTQVTVTAAIMFRTSFLGTKSVYVLAEDSSSAYSGWQQLGVWTPAVNEPPVVDFLVPTSGEGIRQTFTFGISDANGAETLLSGHLLISGQLSRVKACYARYQPVSGLWLRSDSGDTWLGPVPVGSFATLANSQCTVGVVSSVGDATGKQLSISLSIQFQETFVGEKKVYLLAEDTERLNSGWQQMGSWSVSAGRRTIHVPAGGDLQQAIDQAQPGDTITLEAGATYTGNFVLRRKTGSEFITITSADPASLPAPGVRVTPAAAAALPKVVSPNDAAVFSTEPGAHHYRLVGLEIAAAAGIYPLELIALGSGGATSASEQPAEIELDRLYLRGDPAAGGKRAVTLNSGATVIRNCWIAGFRSASQDTQAIGGWNGPGPYTIVNNYLEAAGAGFMLGGEAARIAGLVPADVVIRGNHFFKPAAWQAEGWSARHLLAIQNGRRILIEGNVFEHNWAGADPQGFAVVLAVRTQNGAMPWAVIEDVTFRRNLVRGAAAGLRIEGQDATGGGALRRLLIQDNLIHGIDHTQWGGEGRLFDLAGGPEDVTIDHNTCLQLPAGRHLLGFSGAAAVRFTFTNNVAEHGQLGVIGVNQATGAATLNAYAPGATFLKNALIGGDGAQYPAENFFPPDVASVGFTDPANNDYRLAPSSPYAAAGTDGRDVGADVNAVSNAVANVIGSG